MIIEIREINKLSNNKLNKEMNAVPHSKLNDFYRVYLSCVDESLKTFLQSSSATSTDNQQSSSVDQQAKEWCTVEKAAYYDFMRNNFKTEYENILKLESQNY